MRRALPVLLATLLLAIPAVQAAPNPEIGYVPGPHASEVQPGDTVTYSFSLILNPADGDDDVLVEAFYSQAVGSMAPPTSIALTGPHGEAFTIPAFSSYQSPRSALVALPSWSDRGESFTVTVSATVPEDQPPGQSTSRLNLVARDPDTRSSSPGIIYAYQFTVPNVAPTAAFGYVADFLQVAFDGTASSDPEGEALAYAWDFGDGTASTQPKPSKTFAASGAYAVRLTVTDPHGASDAEVQTLSVAANADPVATFGYGIQGLVVSFDGSLSQDPEGGALTYAWSFGDGASSTQASPSHTYATSGSKLVTLTVTDPQGATGSEVKTIDLAAANHAPTAAFTFEADGLRILFTSGASDPDQDTLTHAWDFGDGGASSVASPSHTFGASGVYHVRLTVTDPHGASDSETLDVTATSPGAGDGDGDGVATPVEETSGSDPGNPRSTPNDRDGDGRVNERDNCPNASNANQADRDRDGIGDACDAVEDGAAADPDGDGRASGQDNCPAASNQDQRDLDRDGLGDACDPDIDGDGTVNEADAFPLSAAESADTDGDGRGDKADTDDDGDGLSDAEELAAGTDPLDRQDPPFNAARIVVLRLENGTNFLVWEPIDGTRAARYLIWREASPLVLIYSVEDHGQGLFRFWDEEAPRHARYHVQAKLAGDMSVGYEAADSRVSNWVTEDGASDEGCEDKPDTDRDGLCDELELQLGLDPARRDTDGDGLDDGDEILGSKVSLPFRLDSDDDGRADGKDRSPLGFGTSLQIDWSLVTIVVLGAAVLVLGVLVLRKRK